MSNSKSDASIIRDRLNALLTATWLGPSRAWWPKYSFHFTDVTNAVNILSGGKLLCRSKGRIETDIASATVINQTDSIWKDYVRLYFRPRTPTQYHNEGFRPLNNRGVHQAHCPMPIFLLFDSHDLLTRETTHFSDGNVAAFSPQIGTDANFFSALPFEKIYHDSSLGESEKRSVIYHRHAEVLIPNELDLSSLKWIACRSEAELRTLTHLLPFDVWTKFQDKLKIVRPLFFRRWTFVEKAELGQKLVRIWFNKSAIAPKPFAAYLDITDSVSNQKFYWKDDSYSADNELIVEIQQFDKDVAYTAKLSFDNAVAYSDYYLPEDFF